jgi:hypothetical protein
MSSRPPLWRQSIDVLRRQFEEASFRYPALNCMLVDASAEQDRRQYLMGPPAGPGWPGADRINGFHNLPGRPPGFRALSKEESDTVPADAPDYLRESADGTGRAIAAVDHGSLTIGYMWGGGGRGGDQFTTLAQAVTPPASPPISHG